MRRYQSEVRERLSFLLSVTGLAFVIAFAVVVPVLPTARSLTYAVSIGDNFFSPASLTVEVGDTVFWTNQGSLIHTVTSTTPAGVLNSGNIAPGGTYSYTFDSLGTFNYRCIYHPMTGSVTVVDMIPEFPSSAFAAAGFLVLALGLFVYRRRK